MKTLNFELVDEFAFGKIDRKEFLQLNDCVLNFSELIRLSLLCKISKNNRRFEVVLWHVPKSISQEEKEIFYRLLLLEDWHFFHEEIVQSFQELFNNNKENILAIKWAMERVPEYLSGFDLKTSYIRKCAYAIAAQPQPESIIALQELQTSEDEIISKQVTVQLSKLAM
ncbi:MAG: hypothetical protein HUU01_07365 [Saprospiraceae bacterium]|nr:hypothetical protein [Saprospiraceae bacterium]